MSNSEANELRAELERLEIEALQIKEDAVVGYNTFMAYEEFRLKGTENALMAVAHRILSENQMIYIMQNHTMLSELYS